MIAGFVAQMAPGRFEGCPGSGQARKASIQRFWSDFKALWQTVKPAIRGTNA